MRMIGIDIGKHGAIATIDGEGFYATFDMPIYIEIEKHKRSKDKRITNLNKRALFDLLKGLKTEDCYCCVERNRPYPQEGVVSSFSLGEQVGLVEGMLIALQIPFELVSPQAWYKELSIVRQYGSKNATYEKAGNMFPRAILKTPRGRILDGRADALLICEYGRRRIANGVEARDRAGHNQDSQ
jgi:hypothetical protein